MSTVYEAEPRSLNYSLPGISSKRIRRRVAIRLNLSKASGRWNETQKTEWPYPSTYVRRQMPEKYISGRRSADYCHVDTVVESNPLIQEYREDFFAVLHGPGARVSRKSTFAMSNIEYDDLYSTEEGNAVVTDEEGIEGFQMPHHTTSATDAWKQVTKIEEVGTDDENREILTNERKRTPNITDDSEEESSHVPDNGLEDRTSDPVQTIHCQDLDLQYLPEDDVFIMDQTQGRRDHSAPWIPHKLCPAAFPIIAIQGSPELDILRRRYDSAALTDEGQYQPPEDQTPAFYPQVQDQTRELYPPFHNPISNFEEARLEAYLFREFNRLQSLQNSSHVRLPRSHDTSTNGLENLEKEQIYAKDLFPSQVGIQKQEQVSLDEMKKLDFYQLGIQQFILDQISLGEKGAPFTTYGRRLQLEDHDNNIHWEGVVPERAAGFAHLALTRAITPLQAFGISAFELERLEHVSLALKEYDLI